jgi:4'-phosphopantetheinyl transferase
MARTVDPLLPEHAHVWVVELDAAPRQVFEELFSSLNGDERRRAARFAFDDDRQRFIACRGLLRMALSAYTGTDSCSLRFDQNEWGKPFLADASMHFNVSHSRGAALLGFTRSREIGVDIEHIDTRVSLLDLAAHCFSAVERDELISLPEYQRRGAFFACWTRKEAYIKARGRGLSLDLRSFDVSMDPETPAWSLKEYSRDVSEAWTLRSFVPGSRCAAAIAIQSPACEITIYRWNWTALSAEKMKLPPLPEGVPYAV